MKFIIFVIDEPGNLGNNSEMANIDIFNEQLQRDGNWVTAAGISAADKSLVIDNRDGKDSVVAGSLVTSKRTTQDSGLLKQIIWNRQRFWLKLGQELAIEKWN